MATGHINSEGIPLSFVQVKASINSVETAYSSHSGQYTMKWPLAPGRSVYPVLLSYAFAGYLNTSVQTYAGGVPNIANVSLEEVSMVPDTGKTANVTIYVYDPGHHNAVVPGMEVTLRTGYFNVTGLPSYLTTTGQTGVASFLSIPVGIYTVSGDLTSTPSNVVLETNSSYIEILSLSPVPRNPGELTVTLAWTSVDVDLDLGVSFHLRPEHRCSVTYIDQHCGGAVLTAQSDSGLAGLEMITLREVSASNYVFFVTSNDTRGFQGAKIRLYSSDFPQPIATFTPREAGTGTWVVFCLNGRKGISSFRPINEIRTEPRLEVACTEVLGGEQDHWEEWQKRQTSVNIQSDVQSLSPMYTFKSRH